MGSIMERVARTATGESELGEGGEEVSTLDLIGDGLTLVGAIADPRWPTVAGPTGFTAPIDEVILPASAAVALGLGSTDALLVRPDGHEVARWSAPGRQTEPGLAWLADASAPSP
jgi:hypothetical protein